MPTLPFGIVDNDPNHNAHHDALHRRFNAAISVLDHGATGDGATDDTVAIQDALDEAADGGIVEFPAGRYAITQVSWTAKRLDLQFHAEAVLVEASAQAGPLVQASNADGSTVVGLTVEGIETSASFDGLDSDRAAIELVDTADGLIRDLSVSGKSWGANLDNCTSCHVERVVFAGMNTAAATPGSGPGGWNFHSAVRVSAGAGHTVGGVHARDCGSAVLIGTDASRVAVTQVYGENLHDNGVYISSGFGCTVSESRFLDVAGTGVKVRGYRHAVVGCETENVGTGISTTGNGAVADADGYNGGYTTIVGNRILTTVNLGIDVSEQDALHPAGCEIFGNSIKDAGSKGAGGYGIRLQGARHIVVGNFVDGTGDHGINAQADAVGYVLANNHIRDTAGDGIRMLEAEDCQVSGNTFANISGTAGVEIRTSTTCTAVGNIIDAGTVVRSIALYPSSDILAVGNVGTVTVDAAHRYGVTQWFADGSAAAPSIGFADDADTGFYRITDSDIGVVLGGAVTARLRASGIRLEDGKNIEIQATTGTKFGLSPAIKMGFYGATPVVRPTGVAADAASIHAALVSLGLIES